MDRRLTRTGNPTLRNKAFGLHAGAGEAMTVSGTVNKAIVMLVLVTITAAWTWGRFLAAGGDPAAVTPFMMLGFIGGFIAALVSIFKPAWTPISAPIYAILEGLAIGGISVMFQARYPGIVPQAVALTFGTLFALLIAYRSGLIKVTDRFRMGVAAATGGIFVFYLVTMIVGFFGVNTSALFGGGSLSIGISLVIVVIAALNLVLDFDFIQRAAAGNAPRYMEWYGAFALMVTLIWLYMEILRLLANSRR